MKHYNKPEIALICIGNDTILAGSATITNGGEKGGDWSADGRRRGSFFDDDDDWDDDEE